MKLILAILLVSNLSWATTCPDNVMYLTEGSKAPCTGYLFSPDMELQVRTEVIQLEKLQEISNKQDELITTLNQRIDNANQQIQVAERSSFIDKVLYLSGGLLVGYLIGHGTK